MMTTNEVWKQYADDIKRYIENKVHDEVITDDILQDTFIKIHTKLHTLKDLNKIKSSDKVVLPGQGSFKSCIDALKKINGLTDSLNEFAIKNKMERSEKFN